jgi:serine/threonine protein kinase
MIGLEHARLLNLPPETNLPDAARQGLLLLQSERKPLERLPAGSAERPAIENRIAALENMLGGFLAESRQRLSDAEHALHRLPPKSPVVPKHRKDAEIYTGLVADIRTLLFVPKVFLKCEQAESALDENPPQRAKARKLLREAREAGRELDKESEAMILVLKVEQRLERLDLDVPGGAATPPPVAATPPVAAPPATPRVATPSGPGDIGGGHGPPLQPLPTPPASGGADAPGLVLIPDTKVLQAGISIGRGRFVLARKLGRGGMGEVWLATDERLKEQVALKFLPPEIRADPGALDDLRRETSRSRLLTHPNIVRIHDLHEDEDGFSCIVMEYVDGPTLLALRLQQESRVLGWAKLEPLLAQLCAALNYAHGEKVVHRDLKPSNVMVDGKGRVKLADFGIAAVMSDSMSRISVKHSTSGTIPYMSPRQFTGERPEPADDIYALGATLYELLASTPPFFRGDIPYQLMHKEAPRLEERLAELKIENEVPEYVRSVILRCLGKTSGERPKSAGAVMEAIRAGELSEAATVVAPKGLNPQPLPKSEDAPAPVRDDPPNHDPAWSSRPILDVDPPVAAEPPKSGSGPEKPMIAPVPALPPERKKPFAGKMMVAALAALAVLGLALYFAFGRKAGPAAEAETARQAQEKAKAEGEEARLAEEKRRAAEAEIARQSQERGAAMAAVESNRLAQESALQLSNQLAATAQSNAVFRSNQLFLQRVEAERLANARGGLVLKTEPAGATVMLGGEDIQNSPATFKGIKVGRYKLRVELDGYETVSREVEIKADEFTIPEAVQLVRQTGTVHLESEPPGATVESGGAVLGTTPLDLRSVPTGAVSYVFKLDGHVAANLSGTVKNGGLLRVVASLAKAPFPVLGAPYENGLGMKFVAVPGTAVLFSIWDTRVRDFEGFVKETGYDATAGVISLRSDGRTQRGDSWKSPGFAQGPTHPVCGVSWEDAEAFCKWLTTRERTAGKIGAAQFYRLPTGDEWSAAVGLTEAKEGSPKDKSGEVQDVYPWGTQWPPPAGAGNYAGTEAADGNWPANFGTIPGYQDGFARTSPVGSFAANRFGLYDMGGNVWQWCEDWDEDFHSLRVLRGASWSNCHALELLSACRRFGVPGSRDSNNGFRCVLVVGGGSR